MNSFKKNILKYGTFALFFLTPILYWGDRIFPYMTSKTFFFYGLANILFFYWLYLIIIDKSYRLSKKQWTFFIPLFLYVIWMTLAGILAVNPHLAFWSSLGRGTGLLTLYYATAVSIVVASLVKRDGMTYVYSLLKWFLVSSLIVALSVLFGNEGFNIQASLFMRSSGGGLIGNSSFTATYLIFAIFLGSFLIFFKTITKKQKIFIGIIIAVVIFSPLFINLCGLMTEKGILGVARGAVLGVIAGIGVIILCYLAFAKNKIVKILGISGIFISLIIFSIGWKQLTTPNTFLNKKFIEVATETRLIFWGVSQDSISKHPWFGYGPENYMIAFLENFNPKIFKVGATGHETWNDRAHNIYYDTGVSGGYPAIIFYSLFILITLYIIFKLFQNGKISRIQASILYGLIIGYIFQNLFVFDSTLSIMILFTLAGLIYGMYSYEDEEKSFKDKKSERLKNTMTDSSVKTLIGGSLTVLCVISWVYFSFLPSRKAITMGNVLSMPVNSRALHYKDFLKGSSIGNDWDIGGIADDAYKSYAIDPMNTKNNKEMLPFYQKDLTNFLEYLEIIAKENPNDFRLHKRMFDLYSTSIFLSDKSSDPVLLTRLFDILNHIKKLSPNNPEVYWAMAQLYAWQGDLKGIEQAYKQGIAVDPSVDASHKLLIKFAQTFNLPKLYNEAIIQAEKDIPGFVEFTEEELNITKKYLK